MKPSLKRGICAAVWFVVASGPSVATASEQSELLWSRGLVEFHQTRFAKALELFEQAVAADPDDVYARYYRAVTRGRLGDSDGAISDLQAVLKAKSDFTEASLDLGVALVEKGRYRDALPLLDRARKSSDLEAQATLFRGIAYLRMARFDAARDNLERAAERDPTLEPTVRYYEGVADYQEQNYEQAEAQFSYVMSARPDTQIGQEAHTFIDKIHAAQAKNFTLFGAVGFQYDSNVVLAPSNSLDATSTLNQLNVSHQADGRVTLNVGGTYQLWHTDWAQLSASYEFYQSLHFRLQSFDLQDHRPSLQFEAKAGPFRLGLIGRYDYYFLDSASFLQEVDGVPYVTLLESDVGTTLLSFRFRRRDFLQIKYNIRDGYNYAPAITQFIYLGSFDRYLSVGYQFDREDDDGTAPDGADPRQFAYNGNQFSAGLGWPLPFDITTDLEYVYRSEVYDPPALGRIDGDHFIIAVARRPITEHLDLTVGYFGQLDRSNFVDDSGQKPFEYERHIASVALEVRF